MTKYLYIFILFHFKKYIWCSFCAIFVEFLANFVPICEVFIQVNWSAIFIAKCFHKFCSNVCTCLILSAKCCWKLFVPSCQPTFFLLEKPLYFFTNFVQLSCQMLWPLSGFCCCFCGIFLVFFFFFFAILSVFSAILGLQHLSPHIQPSQKVTNTLSFFIQFVSFRSRKLQIYLHRIYERYF